MAEKKTKFDLIITVVNRGYATDVIQISRKAGAKGGTIICGRGAGIHEDKKIFGIPIEPEKEIVLTIIEHDMTDGLLEAIKTELKLDKPGKGIAFVLDVEKVVGITNQTC